MGSIILLPLCIPLASLQPCAVSRYHRTGWVTARLPTRLSLPCSFARKYSCSTSLRTLWLQDAPCFLCHSERTHPLQTLWQAVDCKMPWTVPPGCCPRTYGTGHSPISSLPPESCTAISFHSPGLWTLRSGILPSLITTISRRPLSFLKRWVFLLAHGALITVCKELEDLALK